MKITPTHIYFWKGFLSQWFKSDMYDAKIDTTFNCCEQFMMYEKAMFFNDLETASKILKESNPRKQKELGRSVKGYDDVEWNKIRQEVVEYANFLKFSQNNELKKNIILTSPRIIVEASPVDCIWGVGLVEDDPLILDEKNWRGLNLLGKSLMNVRDRLNNER